MKWPKTTGDIAVDYAIAQSKAIQKCMHLDAEMAYRSLPKRGKSYNEEEVYSLLEEAMKDCYASELEHHHSGDYRNLKEWFEQFKK